MNMEKIGTGTHMRLVNGLKLKSANVLILFFVLFTNGVIAQSGFLKKGVLSKPNDAVASSIAPNNFSQRQFGTSELADSFQLEQVSRFVRKDRVFYTFLVTNTTNHNYLEVQFALWQSDDELISINDRQVFQTQLQYFKAGQTRKIQAVFTVSEGDLNSVYTGYTLSEKLPDLSLAKTAGAPAAGARIRIDPTTQTIIQNE